MIMKIGNGHDDDNGDYDDDINDCGAELTRDDGDDRGGGGGGGDNNEDDGNNGVISCYILSNLFPPSD